MPIIGDNESGEITKWHKQIGDKLAVDDILCEIEMDDLTIDLEADEDGYLAEITIPEGITVKSGTTIARQVKSEEELSSFNNIVKNSKETAERDLVFAYRILSELGYGKYINMDHLSVSIPSNTETPWNRTMITGKASFCWHNITRRDLTEIDVSELLKEKKTMQDIELMDIYCSLIQNTPTINTLIHCNTSNFLTFSSMTPNELLMVNPLCARFKNRVMNVDAIEEIYVGNFITIANVIVIKNYGVIITGSSIEQAFDTFFYFEQMVGLQLKMMNLKNGNPDLQIAEMDSEQIEQLQRKYHQDSYRLAKQHFDARKRSILETMENLLESEE